MAAPVQYIPVTGSGGGSGTDERVKVSISDTTAGYLSSKIGSGIDTPISFDIINPSGNESIELNLDGDKIYIDWVPSSYTRNSSPTEVTEIAHLTAHLKGIDDQISILESELYLTGVTGTDTTPQYLADTLVANADTPITFNVLNPGTNETLELQLDGDKVDIDFNPSNYTPDAAVAEADDVDDLAAHLYGIDAEFSDLSALEQRTKLENQFNFAYNNHYTELSYDGSGNLTTVEIWEDNTKALKLFTRTLSYTGSDLTSATTTDELTLVELTKTFTYDVDGNLTTVTATVT